MEKSKPLVVTTFETPLCESAVSSKLMQETLGLMTSILYIECTKERDGLPTSKIVVE